MMSAPAPKSSGVVIPRQLSWHRRILASAVALLYWLSIKTWRRVWKDAADNSQTTAPVIYCIWHSHLMLAVASYDDHALEKWHEKGLVAWVSASGDGAFLAAVLAKLGYSIAMAPDGPRGPSHQIQDGILSLAQVSGRPIIPISNFTRWKICLKNWDRTQIPLPFARCELYDNDPVWVPRDATAADREQLRSRLEQSMRAITPD